MDEPVKRCSTCGEIKPLSEFHKKRASKDGHQGRCKPCNIANALASYRRNPKPWQNRTNVWKQVRREEVRELLLAYLHEHPCVDCGEPDPIVLEFDHLRDKVRNVSALVAMGARWDRILAEIEKCDVVCANCHRRRTAARVQSYRHRKSTSRGPDA